MEACLYLAHPCTPRGRRTHWKVIPCHGEECVFSSLRSQLDPCFDPIHCSSRSVSKAAASRRRRTPAKTHKNNDSEQREKEIQLELSLIHI